MSSPLVLFPHLPRLFIFALFQTGMLSDFSSKRMRFRLSTESAHPFSLLASPFHLQSAGFSFYPSILIFLAG